MSTRSLAVVLYHYDGSPFATKVKNMLMLKHIPHKRVNVSMTMPRPELSELLGVTYRRIPVLAIGNDMYCDTSLIASVLEHRFPASDGYGTLFPTRVGSDKSDTGLTLALMMYWSDRAVFPLAANQLPYAKFPASFIQDRGSWLGTPVDVESLVANQPATKSTLAAHLTLLEHQLSDGREWLMDTTTPGLADISAHFVFNWIRFFRNVKDLFDTKIYPSSVAWIVRMSDYLDKLQKDAAAPFEDISGLDAAKIICSNTKQHHPVPFDQIEASRLSITLGEPVSVSPSDIGKVPTVGKLLAVNREELVIETHGKAGTARCHFPRLGFSVKATMPQTDAKL